MENDVYISVITPCYNSAAFIESAILSVIKQPVNCIEMIVVDDGSTDETESVCTRYSDRIRYYKTENKGAGHARNFALEKAKGTWIAYLDADDLILYDGFSTKLISELQDLEKRNVDVLYTPWITVDMKMEKSLYVYLSEPEDSIQHIPNHEFWTCLYRRKFLIDNQIKFYEYREQDIASAFRYLVFSKVPYVQTRNDIRFLVQRINPQSNTHTWKSQVMHGVKAQVYFDLWENCSVEKSESWLLGTVIEEVRVYYKNVIREGYCSKETLRRINQICKGSLKYGAKILRLTRNKKHFIANFMLCALANTVFNRKMDEKKVLDQITDKQMENSGDILRKLRALSELLLIN